MLRWLKGRGARPSAVAEMQARISPELWRQVLRAHPFLAALDDQEGAQLLARSAWLLASKSINGAQGLDVTDAMRLSIAAQAQAAAGAPHGITADVGGDGRMKRLLLGEMVATSPLLPQLLDHLARREVDDTRFAQALRTPFLQAPA